MAMKQARSSSSSSSSEDVSADESEPPRKKGKGSLPSKDMKRFFQELLERYGPNATLADLKHFQEGSSSSPNKKRKSSREATKSVNSPKSHSNKDKASADPSQHKRRSSSEKNYKRICSGPSQVRKRLPSETSHVREKSCDKAADSGLESKKSPRKSVDENSVHSQVIDDVNKSPSGSATRNPRSKKVESEVSDVASNLKHESDHTTFMKPEKKLPSMSDSHGHPLERNIKITRVVNKLESKNSLHYVINTEASGAIPKPEIASDCSSPTKQSSSIRVSVKKCESEAEPKVSTFKTKVSSKCMESEERTNLFDDKKVKSKKQSLLSPQKVKSAKCAKTRKSTDSGSNSSSSPEMKTVLESSPHKSFANKDAIRDGKIGDGSCMEKLSQLNKEPDTNIEDSKLSCVVTLERLSEEVILKHSPSRGSRKSEDSTSPNSREEKIRPMPQCKKDELQKKMPRAKLKNECSPADCHTEDGTKDHVFAIPVTVLKASTKNKSKSKPSETKAKLPDKPQKTTLKKKEEAPPSTCAVALPSIAEDYWRKPEPSPFDKLKKEEEELDYDYLADDMDDDVISIYAESHFFGLDSVRIENAEDEPRMNHKYHFETRPDTPLSTDSRNLSDMEVDSDVEDETEFSGNFKRAPTPSEASEAAEAGVPVETYIAPSNSARSLEPGEIVEEDKEENVMMNSSEPQPVYATLVEEEISDQCVVESSRDPPDTSQDDVEKDFFKSSATTVEEVAASEESGANVGDKEQPCSGSELDQECSEKNGVDSVATSFGLPVQQQCTQAKAEQFRDHAAIIDKENQCQLGLNDRGEPMPPIVTKPEGHSFAKFGGNSNQGNDASRLTTNLGEKSSKNQTYPTQTNNNATLEKQQRETLREREKKMRSELSWDGPYSSFPPGVHFDPPQRVVSVSDRKKPLLPTPSVLGVPQVMSPSLMPTTSSFKGGHLYTNQYSFPQKPELKQVKTGLLDTPTDRCAVMPPLLLKNQEKDGRLDTPSDGSANSILLPPRDEVTNLSYQLHAHSTQLGPTLTQPSHPPVPSLLENTGCLDMSRPPSQPLLPSSRENCSHLDMSRPASHPPHASSLENAGCMDMSRLPPQPSHASSLQERSSRLDMSRFSPHQPLAGSLGKPAHLISSDGLTPLPHCPPQLPQCPPQNQWHREPAMVSPVRIPEVSPHLSQPYWGSQRYQDILPASQDYYADLSAKDTDLRRKDVDLRSQPSVCDQGIDNVLRSYCRDFLRDGMCNRPMHSHHIHDFPALELGTTISPELLVSVVECMCLDLHFWMKEKLLEVVREVSRTGSVSSLLRIADFLWYRDCQIAKSSHFKGSDKEKLTSLSCHWHCVAKGLSNCGMPPHKVISLLLSRVICPNNAVVNLTVIDNIVETLFFDFIKNQFCVWDGVCKLASLESFEMPVLVLKEVLRDTVENQRPNSERKAISGYLVKNKMTLRHDRKEEAEVLHLIYNLTLIMESCLSTRDLSGKLREAYAFIDNYPCCNSRPTSKQHVPLPLSTTQQVPYSRSSLRFSLADEKPLSRKNVSSRTKSNVSSPALVRKNEISASVSTRKEDEEEVSSSTEGMDVQPTTSSKSLLLTEPKTAPATVNKSNRARDLKIKVTSTEGRRVIGGEKLCHRGKEDVLPASAIIIPTNPSKPLKSGQRKKMLRDQSVLDLINQKKFGLASSKVLQWRTTEDKEKGCQVVCSALLAVDTEESISNYNTLLAAVQSHHGSSTDSSQTAIIFSVGLLILKNFLDKLLWKEAFDLYSLISKKLNPLSDEVVFVSPAFALLVIAEVLVRNGKVKESLDILLENKLQSQSKDWSRAFHDSDIYLRDHVCSVILTKCKSTEAFVLQAEKLFRDMLDAKESYKFDVGQKFYDCVLRALVRYKHPNQAFMLMTWVDNEHHISPNAITSRLLLTQITSLPESMQIDLSPQLLLLLNGPPYEDALPASVEGLKRVNVVLQSVWFPCEVRCIILFLLNSHLCNSSHEKEFPAISVEIKEAPLPAPAPGEEDFPEGLREADPSVQAMQERALVALTSPNMFLHKNSKFHQNSLFLSPLCVENHVFNRRNENMSLASHTSNQEVGHQKKQDDGQIPHKHAAVGRSSSQSKFRVDRRVSSIQGHPGYAENTRGKTYRPKGKNTSYQQKGRNAYQQMDEIPYQQPGWNNYRQIPQLGGNLYHQSPQQAGNLHQQFHPQGGNHHQQPQPNQRFSPYFHPPSRGGLLDEPSRSGSPGQYPQPSPVHSRGRRARSNHGNSFTRGYQGSPYEGRGHMGPPY